MSWGSCHGASNNIYHGSPPIMADGRNYASWLPGGAANEALRKEAGIKTNYEYRQYLTANADRIIKTNQLEACDQCCVCPPVYGRSQPNTSTPFLYHSCAQTSKPYGYENSDMKEAYLSSYQLECRLMAPVMTQYDYLTRKYPNWN